TDQRWASISGSPRDIDRSFGVTIDDYRTPGGRVVYAADRPAAVPNGVCDEVAGIGTIHSLVQPVALSGSSRSFGGLNKTQLLQAYDIAPLVSAGNSGQGQTVVFLEGSGPVEKDLQTFRSDEHLPSYNLLFIGSRSAGSGSDETTMDIETVHEIAPAAHLVVFNLNSLPGNVTTAELFAEAFTKAAARWPHAIFSVSLGLCESDPSIFDRSDLVAVNSAVAKVEGKGATVFASSGDSGGLDCTPDSDDGDPPQSSFEGVSVPASLPAVTGVGGTALSTDATGRYIRETTWSEPLLSQGSGGGVAGAFARPTWQVGVGTGGQSDTGNGREVPDVSADSDPSTGNFIVDDNNQAEIGGGTSLAAPIWAGATAIMDQYLSASHHPPIGFFNPALYHLANSKDPYRPFHDVTVGGNDFYPATPGYDMVTGLGSPNVFNLARDLAAAGY
ncbi:MAG: S53 family peptidase, partial [Acidimicrobiales bacterium]